MSSQVTAPRSPTDLNFTENVVPAMSTGLGCMGDLNIPSFLFITLTDHHDGIVSPIMRPAGIPSNTLK